ncbi:MAG: glycosyltransferase family 39 protein [Candidatus Omnitrophica bacterium]|nr:glycosyltransferase family 39 protein [Candidatus Omnitrophota bacterium]
MRNFKTTHVFIFALFFFLRIWGITFGLPYDGIHPTENFTIANSLRYAALLDFKPLNYQHPALFQYLIGLAGVVLRIPVGLYPVYYLLGRLFSCAASFLSVYVLYIIGKRLFNSAFTGMVCAAFLGVNVLSVKYAHYGVPDSLCVLFITLSLLYALEIVKNPVKRNYVLCGLFCGLSMGSKFYGLIALVTLVCAYFASVKQDGKRPRGEFFPALSVSVLVFCAVSPFHIIHFKEALTDFSGYLSEKGYLRPAGVQSSGLLMYPFLFLQENIVGTAGVLFGLGGAAGMFLRDRKRFAVVIMPAAFFLLALGLEKGGTLQNILPFLPFVSVSGAYFFFVLDKRVNRKLLTMVLFVFFLAPGIRAGIFDYYLLQKDTRVLAEEWLRDNVPAKTKIGFEAYTPFDLRRIQRSFAAERFDAEYFIPSLSRYPAAYFVAQGYDYIVTGGFREEMYRSFCEREGLCEGYYNYQGYAQCMPLAARFTAPRARFFGLTGIAAPWGTWPHNPEIKIYEVRGTGR